MAPQSAHAETPFHINFEQQKKRAKELRDDLRRADENAVARFAQHHPKAAQLGADEIIALLSRLNDAQLVIARELGLPSWPKLKMHAMAMKLATTAITQNEPAPDADMDTLHIRCGSDLQKTLPEAGFVGAFLEYSNPFCQGPVTGGPDMVAVRAEFLSRTYQLHSIEETRARLEAEETRLSNAAQAYARVVLWFEHDSFDQLILIRILAHFSRFGAPETLELVDLNHFPGSVRFVGLGQLPPEAIRMLWARRSPVTAQQLAQGSAAWTALQAPSPMALANIVAAPDAALPNLPGALRRHLQELPSTANGLALTEQLILEILVEGTRPAGQIFRALLRGKEPRPWLGDLMFWHILRAMTRVSGPVFGVISQNGHPGTADDPLAGGPDWQSPHPPRELAITDTGRAILAGHIDWLSLGPPERWLGGIRIAAGEAVWRWDPGSETPVLI